MINGIKEPAFWTGVVEDRNDPLKLGRVRVRIIGLHTYDMNILPTSDLPWAYCIQPVQSASIAGIGHTPIGPVEGTWVSVVFIDQDRQKPFVTGTLPGIANRDMVLIGEEDQGVDYTVKPDGDTKTPWADYDKEKVGKFEWSSVYTSTDKIIDHIKSFEGFSATPYKDGRGIWTIGYGTTTINGYKVTKDTPAV
jgi:GH24 family phage-related lysozyme (muramidase)